MQLTALADWLAESGLRNLPLEEMVDGFSRRLNDMGVPVARTFVGMNTLHPMVRARSMIWDRATGLGPHFEFGHGDIDSPIVRESPFAPMLRDGIAERRSPRRRSGRRPRGAGVRGTARGGHDGVAGPRLSHGRADAARSAVSARPSMPSELGLVCSVTTDRPGGYLDSDLAILKQAAAAVRARRQGRHPARRSATGCWPPISATIRRAASSPAPCSAARCRASTPSCFFTDLRGFTALADVTPGKELIALLDECFECMVAPVVQRGGEVLKFMGDGLLAAFAAGPATRAEACQAALDAATEALALIEALNERRRAEGRPATELDISLHLGTVQYGNVGTAARLDFTVIGPAVNEASRIEKLCEPLGPQPPDLAAVRRGGVSCRSRLVSLGRHRLRGVREETELFGLA